jgi:hypothetical protein
MDENQSAAVNEWDQLVIKMGKLTLAAAYLEIAIITIVCGILGESEEEITNGKWPTNKWWCDKLNTVAPASWSTADKQLLATCLSNIRDLYLRRNRMIHAALGIAADGSVPSVPPGSVIDLRTYGLGFSSNEGNKWTIGVVGKRVELREFDELTEKIRAARLSLVPFMELVDKIKHPARPFPLPELGKRL